LFETYSGETLLLVNVNIVLFNSIVVNVFYVLTLYNLNW